uniref:Astacin domain-containing protein n=1 Tax=Strongyloides papillosus TaxID=174720 RepID=A0A0N5C8W4_STREA
MNLSILIVLISVLSILPNVAESQSSNKSTKLTKTIIPPYPTSPNSIVYYTSNKLGDKLIQLIVRELLKLSQSICLKFQKQSSIANKIGINFYYSKTKNYVKLSDSVNKPTKVFLKKDIAENTNELLFFIGLALGLVPEITRKYSNLFVKVANDNISSSKLKYYQVKEYESKIKANSSFDHLSKMLSSPYFGSKNKEKTYTLKSNLAKYYEKIVYQTEFFSYNDIKRLWYLYCDQCKKYDCKNNGFYKYYCTRCDCPAPFTGNKCEKIQANDKSCSNTQELSASPVKNFHTLKNIQAPCSYLIKSPNGKRVKFEILYLNLSNRDACEKGYGVEVKYRNDKGAAGLVLCNNYANISFPSASSEVYLMFSDTGNNNIRFSYSEV